MEKKATFNLELVAEDKIGDKNKITLQLPIDMLDKIQEIRNKDKAERSGDYYLANYLSAQSEYYEQRNWNKMAAYLLELSDSQCKKLADWRNSNHNRFGHEYNIEAKIDVKATNFLQHIEQTNEPKKCYFIQKHCYEDSFKRNKDPFESTILPTVYLTEEEARDAIRIMKQDEQANFGEYIELDLNSTLISPEDIKGKDIEKDYMDILFSNMGCVDEELFNFIDAFEINHDYKNLKDSIVVLYSWDTHIGYARRCEEVRYGFDDETEKDLLPSGKVSHTEMDVLLSAKQLEGKSKDEINKLVHKLLDNDRHWKWRNDAHEVANVNFAIEQERKVGRRM